ncbi:hypothetical protein [Methanobrevibacter sp.]|uniref:hypothetical protein n=1 Tax=Methanobrevibacter sp. TaxID=66852 RepID=UPI0038659FBF
MEQIEHKLNDDDILTLKEIILDLSKDYKCPSGLDDFSYELVNLAMGMGNDTRVKWIIVNEPPVVTERVYVPNLYILPKGEMKSMDDNIPEVDVYCHYASSVRKWFSNQELDDVDSLIKWRIVFGKLS